MLVEKTPSTVLVEGVSFSQATLESACADGRNTGSLCWIRHIWNLNIETETPDFRKCGEKAEPSEHKPNSDNKTAGRGSIKPESGRQISVFPAFPNSQNGSMRQIPEPPTTPPFSRKETAGRGVDVSRCGRQVNNLPHTSGFD